MDIYLLMPFLCLSVLFDPAWPNKKFGWKFSLSQLVLLYLTFSKKKRKIPYVFELKTFQFLFTWWFMCLIWGFVSFFRARKRMTTTENRLKSLPSAE